MVGLCAASQIAAASAMSFFCRFTKGFISRWDQPHFMAELADLTSPVMRARAGFDRHEASRLLGKECQQLIPAQLFAKNDLAGGIGSMGLKDILR
ncbi:hypothetical protein ACM42_21505 [Bradyrhizobium sp. CCBAU 25338]|nr:hypothetical protein [Bradyrhizobium sp. CCBAU 25338]